MKAHFSILLLVSATLATQTATGQSSQQKTGQERAKTDSLTKLNYQQVLQRLAIKLPTLPPQAEDPNRPKNAIVKGKGVGYNDDQGRNISRSAWGAWINYDEVRANDYVLPDPLILKGGKAVTSAKIWWTQRRPEIVTDYESEVFGRIPKNTPSVSFDVTETDTTALASKAIKKTIIGRIDNAAYPKASPVINITMYRPKNAKGQVPLVVIISSSAKGNNQTIELLNQTGWAVAIFDTNSLQADNGAGLNLGIIGLVNKGQFRKPDDWGVLRAWSWGLSKALDYFQKDKSINPKKIGIQGHSRWGKTALLAAAMDTRWAAVFASCSGSGGASLEKRNFGENLDVIAGESEYHWMAPNFVKYGGNWESFPVDAHQMIALIAPRPLFITGGTQDIWADPVGEFKACVAASPVYKLLGKTGITTTQFPAPDVSLIDGELAFRFHEGGHTDSMDWPIFISFAKKYFN
ncbi:hypothetical protein [Pedobacter miscanthi]|jgi:hypothetical protein|uniref:alpha/beta hydrolase family protein n=1 Tax=Pedobacter miscanthi TaxID=2259170 RepID=UPI002930C4F5|nr:hypothetical protein [Pedobacter miscanthi]